MKKIVYIAMAATALAASPALAQNASGTVGVSGSVAGKCTAPWRIAVSSANGALKSAAAVAPGYTNVAPYQVKLNVNSDAGFVESTCDVAQLEASLASSTCNFKGTASPSQGLYLQRSYGLAGSYIQVAAPAYPGPNTLVEGMYYDTLTVTVSPAT